MGGSLGNIAPTSKTWYDMHIESNQNITYIWVYVKGAFLTMWIYGKMFELIMFKYMEDVWLNYGDEVWIICIQLVIIWWCEYLLICLWWWFNIHCIYLNNWIWRHKCLFLLFRNFLIRSCGLNNGSPVLSVLLQYLDKGARPSSLFKTSFWRIDL